MDTIISVQKAIMLKVDRYGHYKVCMKQLIRGINEDVWTAVETGGKHGLSLLRSSGDSIRRFDENAWIDVISMLGRVRSLHSD
ncbi:hypothetical protein F2Q69_00059746 [Brassica cretica]|uniref:Uncharacterized protein n=1 Tax=Brassica cretica TaxID=69181 RepID=A0A8S9RKR5_BRACR|nr:hypothetical protein F2Q69_00059746 [Brassica cretica]